MPSCKVYTALAITRLSHHASFTNGSPASTVVASSMSIYSGWGESLRTSKSYP